VKNNSINPYEITWENQEEFKELHQTYLLLMGPKTKITPMMLRDAPTEVLPNFTPPDYKTQYVRRYFAQKASDKRSAVVEIDYEQYKRLGKTPFYSTLKVGWKISGSQHDIYEGSVQQDEGVIKYNKTRAEAANKKMPGIIKKLNNPLQFYKPS